MVKRGMCSPDVFCDDKMSRVIAMMLEPPRCLLTTFYDIILNFDKNRHIEIRRNFNDEIFSNSKKQYSKDCFFELGFILNFGQEGSILIFSDDGYKPRCI